MANKSDTVILFYICIPSLIIPDLILYCTWDIHENTIYQPDLHKSPCIQLCWHQSLEDYILSRACDLSFGFLLNCNINHAANCASSIIQNLQMQPTLSAPVTLLFMFSQTKKRKNMVNNSHNARRRGFNLELLKVSIDPSGHICTVCSMNDKSIQQALSVCS